MGLFEDWCDKEATKDRHKHYLKFVEKAGGRDAIRHGLAETMRSHYYRLDRIAADVARLGYNEAAEILRTVLPTKDKARSGDLGEIVATELVEEETGFRVPVRRLRYKDGREMALRGDDFIGVAYDPDEKLWLLKGEAKSNKVLSKTTIAAARAALQPGPALGRFEDYHRPARAREVAVDAGVLMDFLDLLNRDIERRGHRLVHQRRIVTLDEVGSPPVAAEQLFQFLAGDAGEDSRVGNLVAVKMQNRQHGAAGYRIEKLVGMPCGGERSRLRLAIADDAGDDEIGIVEHCAERMAERIAQFAALVDRAGALGRCVTGDSARKGKLDKQLPQPGLILADIGIDLAVSAFKISVSHDSRAAAARAGDVNHV